MTQLQYLAPTSVAEAVKALAGGRDHARALSGGTDLLIQVRSGRAKPAQIVDLKRIPGLIGIGAEDGGFVIGSATSGAMLGEHKALTKAWPGVVEGANLIGSTQVQGRASLGGNVCNASPAADSVPGLIAARAVCVIAGPSGQRLAPIETIVTGPGQTSLNAGEFIIAFRLPPRPRRAADAYLRMIPRTEMDIAIAGAAVNLVLDDNNVCIEAHIALGAVAPTAVLVAAAGRALLGTTLDEAALSAMQDAVRGACAPISDKRGTADYRTKIAAVLASRAALIAYDRARNAT